MTNDEMPTDPVDEEKPRLKGRRRTDNVVMPAWTYGRRRVDKALIQPWVWALGVSLLLQIIGAAYITGTVTEKLEGVASRVQRIETQMDQYLRGK